MERNPISNDARKARRRNRGAPEACCLCGKKNAFLRRVNRSFLEQHHVAGIANDDELWAWLCPNCHAEAGEGLLRAGVDLAHDRDRSILEIIWAVLVGIAAFLCLLAERLQEWAELLLAFIRALDEHDSSWRELPEAQR